VVTFDVSAPFSFDIGASGVGEPLFELFGIVVVVVVVTFDVSAPFSFDIGASGVGEPLFELFGTVVVVVVVELVLVVEILPSN
jgi:hypothetical protein